jgi:hypothetical protein
MERPIIFSSPMIQAILDGRKTQTRRIIKPSLGWDAMWIPSKANETYKDGVQRYTMKVNSQYSLPYFKCPYGSIGSILWVRETWRPTMNSMPTGWPYDYKATVEADGTPIEGPWKPSIFMPREACRIRLEITNIRVERVQDISEADAIAEGVESWFSDLFQETRYKDYETPISDWRNPDSSYRSLWTKINGTDSWNSNPWVWVVEFKRIEP